MSLPPSGAAARVGPPRAGNGGAYGARFYDRPFRDYWVQASRSAAPASQPETVEVSRVAVAPSIHTTRCVVSNLDVEIKSKASAQIIRLPYDVTVKVRQGEMRIEMDPVDEQLAVMLAGSV